MSQEGLTAKFRVTNMIFAAFGAGQVLFMLVSYMMVNLNGPSSPELTQTMQIATIVVGITGIAAGIFLYNQQAAAARASANEDHKYASYQTACLLQWATTEAPALLSIVSYLLTGDVTFLMLFGGLILYFIFRLRPLLEKFSRDFN